MGAKRRHDTDDTESDSDDNSESGSEGDTEGDGSDRHSKRRRRGRVYELRRSARPGTCRHLNVNIRLR